MNSYSKKCSDINEIKNIFSFEGAVFENTEHAYFRAKGTGYVATLYKSGKLLIQGSNVENLVKKYFEQTPAPVKVALTNAIFQTRIGTDESGKGDFFGALTAAGVLVDESNEEKFIKLGIKDSKKLTDERILKLAVEIKQNAVFDVVAINPLKYNELYAKFKNLNRLLAWAHATVFENILAKKPCENAISDQFGDEKLILNALKQKGKSLNLVQMHRAESDTAVAAASILARAEFVNRMKAMEKKYGISFPKGCNDRVVAVAKEFVGKYGKEELKNVAKLHFKTTSNVFGGNI